MSERDELFRKFGPILLEGCLMIIFEEINALRFHLGLPLRTKQQFLDQINNHTSTLEPYDWMEIPE